MCARAKRASHGNNVGSEIMAILKAKDIEGSLLKKGFVRDNKGHRIFWFYHNGERQRIRTMTSHNSQEVAGGLLKEMARQIKLSKDEFVAFVSCKLSADNYIKLMTERGHI